MYLKLKRPHEMSHSSNLAPQMDQFAERLSVFTTRCKLSDDEAGRELMRRLNAQCLEAGMNIGRLYDRWVAVSEETHPQQDRVYDPGSRVCCLL